MSITNILPICVWCDVPKMGKKHKNVTDYIKDMPRIETTIDHGDILYKCQKCGEGQIVTMDKDGKRIFGI